MAKNNFNSKSSKELIINLNKKLSRLEAIDAGDLTRSTYRVHAAKNAYNRRETKFSVRHLREGAY